MAEEQNRILTDQFLLRLPDGMRDLIKAAADANKRSMNAEILARLEATFTLTGAQIQSRIHNPRPWPPAPNPYARPQKTGDEDPRIDIDIIIRMAMDQAAETVRDSVRSLLADRDDGDGGTEEKR